jgi:hypothetical protein
MLRTIINQIYPGDITLLTVEELLGIATIVGGESEKIQNYSTLDETLIYSFIASYFPECKALYYSKGAANVFYYHLSF